MPISLRAAALRTALERALDEPVHAVATDSGIRILAPAPDGSNTAVWKRVMEALRSADRWGSSGTTAAPEIWAEIDDEVST